MGDACGLAPWVSPRPAPISPYVLTEVCLQPWLANDSPSRLSKECFMPGTSQGPQHMNDRLGLQSRTGGLGRAAPLLSLSVPAPRGGAQVEETTGGLPGGRGFRSCSTPPWLCHGWKTVLCTWAAVQRGGERMLKYPSVLLGKPERFRQDRWLRQNWGAGAAPDCGISTTVRIWSSQDNRAEGERRGHGLRS